MQVSNMHRKTCISCQSCDLSKDQSLKKMPVLSLTRILKEYFLFSTLGFTFICNKGERDNKQISVLDDSEVLCVFINHDLLITLFITATYTALATSCQVYPSEYAFKEDSVGEYESPSANCRLYPDHLQAGVYTEQYTHCDGTQLKLTDSDLGQEHYHVTDYYV